MPLPLESSSFASSMFFSLLIGGGARRGKFLLFPTSARSLMINSRSLMINSRSFSFSSSSNNSKSSTSSDELIIVVEEMKSLLKRHGFTLRKEPNGLFHICFCPVCNKSQQISTQKLYLYPKNQCFSCNNCKTKGTFSQLGNSLAAISSSSSSSNNSSSSCSSSASGKIQDNIIKKKLQEIEKILEDLQEISLQEAVNQFSLSFSPEILKRFGCKTFYSPRNGMIFISCPLKSDSLLEIQQQHQESSLILGEYFFCCKQQNGEEIEFFFPSSSSSSNCNVPTLNAKGILECSFPGNSSVIVTDSLKEFLELSCSTSFSEELGQNVDLIFIPRTYLTSSGYSASMLHKYEQIYLWSTHELSIFQSLVSEVGYLKCLRPPPSAVKGENKLNFNEWSKFPHPSLFSLSLQGSSSSWKSILEEVHAVKRIEIPLLSLPSLSQITKGFRPGELTIFSGPTGCGKTTFLSQLSLDWCAQGVCTLWGSFEIKNTRLMAKMLRQIAPKPLDSMSEEELQLLQTTFQSLPLHFMEYFGSTPFEDVLDTMEYATLVYGVKHIVLDNLQFMLSGQDNGAIDKFAIADKVIGQLREFSSKRNVHITLVIHPRKEEDSSQLGLNSISGTAKATQEADTVLLLQNPSSSSSDGAASVSHLRLIEVKKNRFDGTLGSLALAFNRETQMFVEDEAGASSLNGNDAKKTTTNAFANRKRWSSPTTTTTKSSSFTPTKET